MKKIWTFSLLVAGVFAAAIAAQQLNQTPGQGIFYRVSGGKNEMYLLGSIHVGSKEMYPMAKEILDAINKADVIVFECDTTSSEAQASTARMMKSEIRLSERIGPACLEKVEQAAKKLGYSMEILEKMDPWAVTSMITVAAAADEMEAGSSKTASAFGVENMVRKEIKNQRVTYLETAEEQLGLMEAFSPELQEYLLSSACDAVLDPEKKSASDQDVDRWPDWWKEGNARAFADSYIRGMSGEASPELANEYHQSLLVRRNQHMAQNLQQMLEEGENKKILAVVGLMHLVLPEDSIISELEALGYSTEQIVQ